MTEILAGIEHWTTRHPRIGIEVSSYRLVAERVLIDPFPPPGGLDALAVGGPPLAILLTNRHHYRGSGEIVAAFGCPVRCHASGLHEFTHGERVEPFAAGDELPGGVVACEVGAICPDETALWIPAHAALAIADGVVRMPPDGELGFVPDSLLGDDPAGVKAGLTRAYATLLELPFEHLLPAHGLPLVGDGHARLAAFVAGA
jgi:hypothetical protein